MITIEIDEETHTVQDMVYCLNEIARLLEQGCKAGYTPSFTISGDEEEDEDNY